MWEHLACLAHSEQPAAVLLAKFTSLNFAQRVHDLRVCARSQVQASVVCVCVCALRGWVEEFELQRFGSHLVLISMLRHT